MDGFSKNISLSHDLTLSIPESLRQDSTSRYAFFAFDSTMYVIVASIETSDFQSGEVLRTLEDYSYNLKNTNLQCYKVEKEKFYEWSKDYVKRYYRGKDEMIIMTYTFYTTDRPYSILIGYKGEKEKEKAESIIKSIKYKGNLWKQVKLTYKRSTIAWWLFYILIYPLICLSFVMLFNRNRKDLIVKKPYIWSVICSTLILLLTLKGAWLEFVCFGVINIIAFVPCFLIGIVGALSIFDKKDSKNGRNYDSNFDDGSDTTEYADIIDL